MITGLQIFMQIYIFINGIKKKKNRRLIKNGFTYRILQGALYFGYFMHFYIFVCNFENPQNNEEEIFIERNSYEKAHNFERGNHLQSYDVLQLTKVNEKSVVPKRGSLDARGTYK